MGNKFEVDTVTMSGNHISYDICLTRFPEVNAISSELLTARNACYLVVLYHHVHRVRDMKREVGIEHRIFLESHIVRVHHLHRGKIIQCGISAVLKMNAFDLDMLPGNGEYLVLVLAFQHRIVHSYYG